MYYNIYRIFKLIVQFKEMEKEYIIEQNIFSIIRNRNLNTLASIIQDNPAVVNSNNDKESVRFIQDFNPIINLHS